VGRHRLLAGEVLQCFVNIRSAFDPVPKPSQAAVKLLPACEVIPSTKRMQRENEISVDLAERRFERGHANRVFTSTRGDPDISGVA
jgi:hypothetical protein